MSVSMLDSEYLSDRLKGPILSFDGNVLRDRKRVKAEERRRQGRKDASMGKSDFSHDDAPF